MNLLDTTPLRHLLRLSPLQPGESLPSLLARLTILNCYDSPLILQQLVRAEWPDRPDCPSRTATFQRLEELTRIDASELYAASDHAIVSTHPPFGLFSWKPSDLSKGAPYWISPPEFGSVCFSQTSHFCPYCLGEGAYHRLAWRAVPMQVCLVHDRLLADACPHCNSPISIRDIILRLCPSCRFDLRQVTTLSIENEIWEHTAQETLWGWLTDQSTADYNNLGWPNYPPPILCYLAEGLAKAMLVFSERFPPNLYAPTVPLKVKNSRIALIHLRPIEIFWAYTSALRWMVDWPDGFCEFLDRCAPQPDSSLEGELGFFYSAWICNRWNNEPFRFIRDAFAAFRTARMQFTRAESKQDAPIGPAFAYANLKETAQILQISKNVVKRLAQIGLIQKVDCSFDGYFLRKDVRAMKNCWNQLLSLGETAEWVGVSSEIVLSLAKEKTLKAEPNSMQNGKASIFFGRNTVARLLEKINLRIINFDFLEEMIPLTEAAQQLACVHLSEVHLIKRVLSDRLHAWHAASQQDDWGIGGISFLQKDIDAIFSEIARSRNWLSDDIVSNSIGIDPDVFLTWVERGIIKPIIVYNKINYFKTREFEDFSAKYIFDYEARKLLDINWKRLLGYIRRGKLKPVAGPGLDDSPSYLLLRNQVLRLARHLLKRKPSVFLTISETQSHYL
ncbi:MAG: TniQ family protein [Chloroflexi bacterium]|nr:TniQ family protein [Chloroflexota bacterium]